MLGNSDNAHFVSKKKIRNEQRGRDYFGNIVLHSCQEFNCMGEKLRLKENIFDLYSFSNNFNAMFITIKLNEIHWESEN